MLCQFLNLSKMGLFKMKKILLLSVAMFALNASAADNASDKAAANHEHKVKHHQVKKHADHAAKVAKHEAKVAKYAAKVEKHKAKAEEHKKKMHKKHKNAK